MTDQSEDRVTIWMAEALKDDVDEFVDWRHSSRSEWLREAAQLRLAVEAALARREMELPDDDEERIALLEDIALAGVGTYSTGEQ